MFLETMIVNLFNRLYIVLCFIAVFDNMDVNGEIVVRIEQKAKSQKYKYSWHVFSYFRQIYKEFLKQQSFACKLMFFTQKSKNPHQGNETFDGDNRQFIFE